MASSEVGASMPRNKQRAQADPDLDLRQLEQQLAARPRGADVDADQLDDPIVAEAQLRVADRDPGALVGGCQRSLDVGREPAQLDRPDRQPRAKGRDRDDDDRRERGRQAEEGVRDPADHVVALALGTFDSVAEIG